MSLRDLLHSSSRYVIPLFQRYYSWGEKEWEQLWEDVIELLKVENDSHFMGSLVFMSEAHAPSAMAQYEVIDGQQRLLTLSLMLCALRDVAQECGYEELAAEVNENFLIHKFGKGQQRYRIFPRQRDRDDYKSVVDRKGEAQLQIGKALAFFGDRIRDLEQIHTEQGMHEVFGDLQGGLQFVHVTLNRSENPYRIFKSLNSTGLDLSEADLIRNFVFMHIALDDQEAFDDDYWLKLEGHFWGKDGKLDGRLLSAFFRDFLMREGQYVKASSIFQSFEDRYSNDFQPSSLVEELLAATKDYDQIRGVTAYPSVAVNKALAKLRRLESSTTYPLLLNLLRWSRQSTLSHAELADAVESLASFILRRYVCGESSRTYGTWFVAAAKQLGDRPLESLQAFLVSRGFPDDSRFTGALVHFNLYESAYARAILDALEQALEPKEQVDLSDAKLIQIEHIMPQSITDAWRAELGDDYARVHEEWLHTLGNLTLTGYNPSLLNNPFTDKRIAFKSSNIALTREVAQRDSWNHQAIAERGQRLAERAADLWPRPQVSTSAPATPSTDQDEYPETYRPVEDHFRRAAAFGVEDDFRRIDKVAREQHRLATKVYKNSIQYAAPHDRNRTLFTVWCEPWSAKNNHLLHTWVSTVTFAQLYPVSLEQAERLLGPKGQRPMSHSDVTTFVEGLDQIFAVIKSSETHA